MPSKMNRTTHKVIEGICIPQVWQFAVPDEWDNDDIVIRNGELFYKDEKQDVPMKFEEVDIFSLAEQKQSDWDVEIIFEDECCSSDEEEEEECDAHPPYRCDGGCGKKMGQGNDDECKRICGDCEEEEIYYCCDCCIKLDGVRDGEEKPDFRCNNCYWEDKEGIDSKNMITPDYRKQEESEEEEEEEEKEYTIEIPVVGLGYCQYYDKEDRDKYVVYCKNAVWKMKGDKTARDMEGNYCETESEAEEEEEDEDKSDEYAECCNCGEDVSNKADGKLVNDEYWCVDCVENIEEDLCEKCEDINCCTKDELICCMCCELLKCDMFSQNCGKCLKPICMDCDNDERKINCENVCEKCERKKEQLLMSKEDK